MNRVTKRPYRCQETKGGEKPLDGNKFHLPKTSE